MKLRKNGFVNWTTGSSWCLGRKASRLSWHQLLGILRDAFCFLYSMRDHASIFAAYWTEACVSKTHISSSLGLFVADIAWKDCSDCCLAPYGSLERSPLQGFGASTGAMGAQLGALLKAACVAVNGLGVLRAVMLYPSLPAEPSIPMKFGIFGEVKWCKTGRPWFLLYPGLSLLFGLTQFVTAFSTTGKIPEWVKKPEIFKEIMVTRRNFGEQVTFILFIYIYIYIFKLQ